MQRVAKKIQAAINSMRNLEKEKAWEAIVTLIYFLLWPGKGAKSIFHGIKMYTGVLILPGRTTIA